MTHAHKASRFRSARERNRIKFSLFLHSMRLVFLSGPKALLTSEISGSCAAFMILLCTPSLLYCALLTLPGVVFSSPEQHAYYYFSSVINQDPARWVILVIVGICTLFALSLPATMRGKPVQMTK